MRWIVRDDLDFEPAGEEQPRSELLREMVDALPEQQRLAISLHYFGGMTQEQTAEEMGLTVFKAKGLITRGLTAIKAMLEAHGVGPVLTADDPRIEALFSAPPVEGARHQA